MDLGTPQCAGVRGSAHCCFPGPDHKLKPSCLFIPCSKFEMDFHFANLEVTHDEDDVILRIRSIPESQKAYKKGHYKKSWLSHVTSDLAAKITTSCTWSEIFKQASACQPPTREICCIGPRIVDSWEKELYIMLDIMYIYVYLNMFMYILKL